MKIHKQPLDIKSGRLFPFHFLILGGVFFLAGVALFPSQVMLPLIFITLGSIILTAYSGTEINTSAGTYREYTSILFIKKGKHKKFASIEKIFINAGKTSQKMYTAHTASSATFTTLEYNAYLKFTDGSKVFLQSDKNKNRLLNKINEAAKNLDTLVVDTTN